MNSFETASLKSLRLLDVNSNIDVFANQWVEENGLADLQDYLSMLDRLNVPYRIVGSDAALAQYEFKVSVHVSETGLAAYPRKEAMEAASAECEYIVLLEDSPPDKPDPNWLGSRLDAFRGIIQKLRSPAW
ncbi:ABC transporter ATP-binding/permease protein [Vibrio maritimus]|uniref:ABC transporter ATP-binding/permease protein n=1 Tax=Vibrio maritimus TaxID=990268 RepID=A0A090S7F1_9VIBR|nr:ABC transporter ATP-binding/permease protein [Vibrio maritimus]